MSEMDVVQGGAVVETATDTNPKRPLPSNCFACGEDVVGPYCYACGQKNDDCRRSIFRLGTEAVGDIFAFDGRVLRTFRSVVTRPGKHVREYGDGRRSPYSPPVRFFLVVSFIFFSTLWLTDTHILTFRPAVIELESLDPETGEPNRRINVEGGFFQSADAKSYSEEDLAYLSSLAEEVSEEDNIQLNGQNYSFQDLYTRSLRVMENPNTFNTALNDEIPRMMIFMIPLLAILGALFIRGKNALIYDHLLLSLNTHSMAFLILTFGLITSGFLPGAVFGWLFFLGVPVYYWAALKGAFGRGYFKTTLSALLILLVYSLLLTISLSIAIFSSFTATL